MRSVSILKNEFQYRGVTKDLIDLCVDFTLNLRQTGHLGASWVKAHAVVATLLSSAIRLDIRDTAKEFVKKRFQLLNKI